MIFVYTQNFKLQQFYLKMIQKLPNSSFLTVRVFNHLFGSRVSFFFSLHIYINGN